MNKLNILVVEDTQENLETAKKYFFFFLEYNFMYATNRIEAEAHLNDAYAVITDRSIPFNRDSMLPAMKIADNEKEFAEIMAPRVNGCILMFKAYLNGKPVVMPSSHGSLLNIFYADNLHPQIIGSIPEDVKQAEYNNYEGLKELLMHIDNNPTCKNYEQLLRYFGYKGNSVYKREWSKTEVRTWELVWEELQKQF